MIPLKYLKILTLFQILLLQMEFVYYLQCTELQKILLTSIAYLSFIKNIRSNKSVKLPCFPQTSSACYQHLYRVYYQVQVWLGNELNPKDWGWVFKDNSLEPIQSLLLLAPEKLLNTIFYNLKKGCNYNCGCKKIGLFCSLVCNNC